MPYYHSGTVGPETAPLQTFTASPGLAREAAFDDAWEGNPASVAVDYFRLRRANQGTRLAPEDAQAAIKTAGVKLDVPEGSYTQEALDMLIARKQDEMRRQDILARAPGGFWQGASRFGVGLAASMLDPLNIASAFVPVVGQARYATLLEQAGTGALARAAIRTRVGALEGAAGAAMLEPGVYLGRTQMQDDYGMADSLLNVAFGTVLGGGLHVVGGRARDYFRGIGRESPTSGIDATPEAMTPEITGLRTADVGDIRVESLTASEPDIPFRRLADLTPDDARSLALQDLAPDLRTQLVAEVGRVADPGTIAPLRAEVDQLRSQLDAAGTEARFREVAKDFQRQGSSRKQAESQARKAIATQRVELEGRISALEQQVEANRQGSVAQQELAALDRGEIPIRFADQVETRAQEILTRAAVQRSFAARTVAQNATPQARRDALNIAVAQMVEGRNIDIDPVIRMGTPEEIADAARRSASPESSALANFQAARAADERLKTAPVDQTAASAKAELDAATARYEQLKESMPEASTRAQGADAELAAFDQGIKDTKTFGAALRAAALCGVRN